MPNPSYVEAGSEADKVIKKQRTAETRVEACIDQLIQQVTSIRDELLRSVHQHGSMDSVQAEASLSNLRGTVDSAIKEGNAATKELHSAIGKLGKVSRNVCSESM